MLWSPGQASPRREHLSRALSSQTSPSKGQRQLYESPARIYTEEWLLPSMGAWDSTRRVGVKLAS